MAVHPQWPYNRTMRWTPDGHLYYRQLSSRGIDVYVIRVDMRTGERASAPRLVLPALPSGASFDVSQDGARLVYSGGAIRTQVHLFRFGPNGGEPLEHRTVTRGTARHIAPRLSPDGQHLAYIRKTGASQDIYVSMLDGSDARRVSVLYQWDRLFDLTWAPDGERLLVHAETGDGPELVVVTLSDGTAERLETNPPATVWMDWSPDGRFIAYGGGVGAYYVLHELGTGIERHLFREVEGQLLQAFFSPDGTQLLVNNLTPENLLVQAVDGAAPRQITSNTYWSRPVLWAGSTVYVLEPDGTISSVPDTGGALTPFAKVPVGCIWDGGTAMSSDAVYFACSVDEQRESDVWVVENFDPLRSSRD
jgi:Tol biopolymer transport system component